ncbi:MAG: hypothetical protein HQM10_08235 [Candidatus Riflebacteria bacterium]|nr:hypothetical protein [Candidatus Riflebacteria bacterium]
MRILYFFSVRTRGVSVVEVLVSVTIVVIIISMTADLLRSTRTDEAIQGRRNRFILSAETLIESLKQDLRSAKKVIVSSDSLEVEKITGTNDSGEHVIEKVSYKINEKGFYEKRLNQEKNRVLTERDKKSDEKLTGTFSVADIKKTDNIARGYFSVSLTILSETGFPKPGLSASMSIRIQTNDILQASTTSNP